MNRSKNIRRMMRWSDERKLGRRQHALNASTNRDYAKATMCAGCRCFLFHNHRVFRNSMSPGSPFVGNELFTSNSHPNSKGTVGMKLFKDGYCNSTSAPYTTHLGRFLRGSRSRGVAWGWSKVASENGCYCCLFWRPWSDAIEPRLARAMTNPSTPTGW